MLDGIVMQKTSFPFVAIILDDCSTDGTTDIIRQYENEYPNLIKGVYFEENQYSQGRSTFNAVYPIVINHSEYVALCEGDDYWTDELKLQKQITLMDSIPECTMSFHNAILHWEDGQEEDRLFYNVESRTYSGEEIFCNWMVATSSSIIRTSISTNQRTIQCLTHKQYFYHDLIFFLLCASLGKVYGMDDVMCVYRRSKDSITSRDLSIMKDSFNINQKFCNHYLSIKEMFEKDFGKVFEKRCVQVFLPFSYNCFRISIKNRDWDNLKMTLRQASTVSCFGTLFYYFKRIIHAWCLKIFNVDLVKVRDYIFK